MRLRNGNVSDALVMFLVTFVCGVLLGAGVAVEYGQKQLRATKATVDSLTQVANSTTAFALSLHESLHAAEDSLQKAKRPMVVRLAADSTNAARADSALAAVGTARDSILTLTAGNEALKAELIDVRALWHLDSLTMAAQRRDADTLAAALKRVHDDLDLANRRVQQLEAPEAPKWLRVTFEAAKIGGAFYGGVQFGKAIAKR